MRWIVRFIGVVLAFMVALAVLLSPIFGIILAVLVMKRPVQALLDGPAGNQLGGPVILLVVAAGLFGGSAVIWLGFVGANEIWRRVFHRNLIDDYDPAFWREFQQ